jgi:uncharacterized RDD family membrane protein YckC
MRRQGNPPLAAARPMPPPARDVPPPASLPRRIAATVVDVVILAVPYVWLSMAHVVLALLAVVLYGAFLESSPRRATLGKRWCGIVVGTFDAAPLTFAPALVRNAVKYGCCYLAGFTYGATLVALAGPFFIRDMRRALHDLAAKSAVSREPGHGLSDIAVGLLSTVVPVLLVAGVLPLVLNPVYEADARREISGVIDSTQPQRAKIAEFHAKVGRLPESLDEAGIETAPPERASMTYHAGVMTLELPRRDAKAQAARLLFTAIPNAGALTWRCRAEGLRKERLPAFCREE